jgi:hypothetical protein
MSDAAKGKPKTITHRLALSIAAAKRSLDKLKVQLTAEEDVATWTAAAWVCALTEE